MQVITAKLWRGALEGRELGGLLGALGKVNRKLMEAVEGYQWQ